jgi:hypothetical protein
MQHIRSSSEEEVISIWLKAEFEGSQRFSGQISQLLNTLGFDPSLLLTPNLNDANENANRREVLKHLNGLDTDDNLLSGFPTQIHWECVALDPNELESILYIDWDYWLKLSGGSRRPADAVSAIKAGLTVYDVPNDGFHEIAAAVRNGMSFPPIIAVTNGEPGAQIVVIEGHARLTGFTLAIESLPSATEVLLGTSPEFDNWWAY